MAEIVNLQIASFAGLGLPRTLNKSVVSTTPACDVLQQIYDALPNPELGPRLIVSTTDGRRLSSLCTDPISSFTTEESSLLPLRLSTRLCGGKGGFGSQLRAAGGRMSSKKNKDRQNATGSNRNLDGRRLRTVDEAKKLAQYLEMKPEMDRKEKEERRERWEAVIQAADETEERIKSGKMGSKQGRLDAEYLENKELAEEKMRDAVSRAMCESMLNTEQTGSDTSAEEAGSGDGADSMHDVTSSDSDGVQESEAKAGSAFFGWDDEYDSEEDEDDDAEDQEDNQGTISDAQVEEDVAQSERQVQHDLNDAVREGKGNGKGKARAL